MTARKLATPTNAELDANPERLRIVAKSNVEKAFYEADSKERLTACLNTTTIRVLAAMLGELTGKSYNPEDACKEYWVARVAEYFIHIRKVRLHEKIRTHSITEIQNNPAFSQLQDLVGGMGYTTAYAILRASAAKDLKAMCKAFNLKNISRLNQKRIYARLLVDFADEYWLLYSDFDERKDDSQPDEIATAEITNASDNDNALASQPAEIANVQSDTNDNAKSLLNADYFKGKSIDEIKRAFSGASLVQLKGFALCYTIPYFSRMNKSKLIDALASKISLILEERYGYMTAENVTGDNGYAQQDDIIIPAPKPRTIPQPVSVKFIPGTVYYGNDSGNHYPVKIIARTADAVTTDFIGAWIKEAKIQTIAGVEYASFMTHYRNIEIWADKQEPSGKPQSEDTAQPEITAHAEIAQPEALYMDDSYSDAPGDNSCPDMDIPEMHTPDAIPNEIAQSEYIPDDILPLVLRLAYAESYDDIFDILNPIHSYQLRYLAHISGITQIPRCENNKKDIKFRLADKLYNQFSCIVAGYPKDFTDPISRIFKEVCSQNPRLKNAKKFPVHNNPGFTIVKRNVSIIKRPPYRKIHDTPQDECTYVTVYACDKPEITPRRNPITEAKFKWVNQFLLAVFFLCKFIIPVMYAKKYNIRDELSSDFTKFTFNTGLKYSVSLHDKIQFITINDRRKDKFGFSWLDFSDEDNISYSARVKLRDDGYTELLDFKEFDRPCYAFEGVKPVKESNRVKYVKFEVGKSYSAVSERWGHHERHITVVDRFAAVPSDRPDATHKTIYIKVRMSGHAIKADYVEGWISCYVNKDNHTEEYSSLSELIFRADNPDAVKEIPAEINDITPETKAQPKIRKHNPTPASDIQHKLIETKDLHFSERRKALEHNAAVISSCMFSEAVISLLSSISLQAILQLGFHMRLFIAKPKGKKNVVADLFAKRLIEYRELRPNVRSNPANINAKYSASVPEGVKFFETKHRQLGFIFTE